MFLLQEVYAFSLSLSVLSLLSLSHRLTAFTPTLCSHLMFTHARMSNVVRHAIVLT